jgi:hypothetical protein
MFQPMRPYMTQLNGHEATPRFWKGRGLGERAGEILCGQKSRRDLMERRLCLFLANGGTSDPYGPELVDAGSPCSPIHCRVRSCEVFGMQIFLDRVTEHFVTRLSGSKLLKYLAR